jgi:hypothetical protein
MVDGVWYSMVVSGGDTYCTTTTPRYGGTSMVGTIQEYAADLSISSSSKNTRFEHVNLYEKHTMMGDTFFEYSFKYNVNSHEKPLLRKVGNQIGWTLHTGGNRKLFRIFPRTYCKFLAS